MYYFLSNVYLSYGLADISANSCRGTILAKMKTGSARAGICKISCWRREMAAPVAMAVMEPAFICVDDSTMRELFFICPGVRPD